MAPAVLAMGFVLVASGLWAVLRCRRVVRSARTLTHVERTTTTVVVMSIVALAALISTFGIAAAPRLVDVAAHDLFGAVVDDARMRQVGLLSHLGEWRLHLVIYAGLVPFLWRSHGWPLALYGAAIIGTGLTVTSLKYGLGRVRPGDMLISLSDRSFPSGHAAMGLAFWFSLGVLIGRGGSAFRRTLGVLLAGALPALIAWTRLFLRVHWLSDVLGGFAIALFWLGLATLADCFAEDEPRLAGWKARIDSSRAS